MLFEEPDSGALLAAARARRFKLETGMEAMLTGEEQVEQNHPDRLVALCEALAQVCDGLSFIHLRGLLHRDVKPSNILVTPLRKAILVDFGLAKRFSDDQITDHGRVVGTYRYMSPEQARGEALDRRSDLYALGATLYDLLAGRPPFTHGNQLELRCATYPFRADIQVGAFDPTLQYYPWRDWAAKAAKGGAPVRGR